MSNMIEAASPIRLMHGEEKVSWARYILNSAVGIAMFGAMLWLAS